MQPGEYIFWHECEEPECIVQVEFDDEPKCFTHSPNEGSSRRGYSAREEKRNADLIKSLSADQKFKMRCENDHEWIETYPVGHTLFAKCCSAGCGLTGKVLERVD